MMTTGEEISWTNARAILHDIGMAHLDWAHGVAVNIVRQCQNTRHRPTYHQQTFLEAESPALLAYLEKLASSGDSVGWRTLRDRVQVHADTLRDSDMQPCRRPWLAAIWHALPELAAIGQSILDKPSKPKSVADFEVMPGSADTDSASGSGGDKKGSAGKTGSAGTVAKPSSRLKLPIVAVILTEAEKKALGLDKPASDADARDEVTPDGPDGTNHTSGQTMSGGPK
ncbi:hypothetical protein G6L26_008595 [Agrobacterium radiobacter]|uniref:Uncharacterized protein n=2 Tax=Agrobacterium TaxID=357 RepID=A0A822UXN2_AGRTU|nr:hypothetical protein [Agrobacterium tumefaciens]KWT87908.1 hypothetical protein ASB65_19610 [Agrobacterium tumefaciens str. B6]MQB28392.1 hypothetical protein [Agrobacterium tumefaciens]NTA91838.1 hypothetical protein [Agrobacterium tumefaciens]NTB12988.1 hypothetical protein [Agrobacterium tumefaciens]OCJ37174.1 hypothetical protein A6U90_24565 [Agrobacterium tumefaciens]